MVEEIIMIGKKRAIYIRQNYSYCYLLQKLLFRKTFIDDNYAKWQNNNNTE